MNKTGRYKFQKYKSLIKIFVSLHGMFGIKVNIILLDIYRYIPGSIGIVLRYLCIKNCTLSCGDNVAVFDGVHLKHVDRISLGNNVSIHSMCYIDGEGGIKIGDNVSVAHGVTMVSANHQYNISDIPIKYQPRALKSIRIGNNCWIAAQSLILAGVNIGDGVVIGANSTVGKNIECNLVVAGTPVRVIKTRE